MLLYYSSSARKTQAEKSNLLSVDESNSFDKLSTSKVLETSSFRGKKLFTLDVDEE